MNKLNKDSVNYSLGMIHSHCGKVFEDDKGYCKHYHGSQEVGMCDKVNGQINPIYWCTQYSKAKK